MTADDPAALKARIRELEADEGRYRATLYGIGDGMIATDARGKVLQMNPVAERLTGWTEAEARGRPVEAVFRIVDEQTREPVESPVARVLREGAVVGLANRTLLVARDGTERPIADSGAPIRDVQGTVTGVVLVFRDQTEERRAQDREVHLKRMLLASRNVNQLIVAETDPQRLIDRACADLTETLGYFNAWIALFDESGETVTLTAAAGFDGGFEMMRDLLDRGVYCDCMRRTLAREDLVVVADPMVECTDCPLAIHYAGRSGMTRRLMHAGRIFGILSVSVPAAYARDKEARQLFGELAGDLAFALHRIEADAQRRRLAHIVTTTPHPMAFVSRDYRYLAVNDAYTAYYGVDREAILQGTVADFLGMEAFRNEIQPELDRCLAGETVRYEIEADFPAKGRRWMQMEYRPYRNELGRVTGVVSQGLDITRRRRAEAALRAALEQQEAVFESSMVGIMLLHNRIITRVNQRMAEMLGYAREELEGRGPEQIHLSHENFVEFGEKYYWRLAERAIVQMEYPLRHKDGRTIWCLFSGRAIAPPDMGRGAVWTIDDITERRRAEQALKDHRAELEQILEALPDALVYADTERRIMRVNSAFERIFGYRPEEVLGKKTEVIYARPEEFAQQGRQRYNLEARKTHDPYEIDYRRKNGEIFPSETIGTPVRDTRDQVIGLLGLVRDITVRKRRENALHQSEETLRDSERQKALILNAAAEMIAYYDLDLRVIWANRAAGESVGQPPEALVGEHCYAIWHGRKEPCPGCPVLAARNAGEPRQTEAQTPDGRYWSVRGYPVLDETGQVVSLVEFGQDITAFKQAEQERERLNEQFHQAQKLESIGRLAGGVAHDLNNLLTPILGYGEMLQEDTTADDPRREAMEEIVQSAIRARDLVRQLLAFSRKQTLEFKPVDLNRLLDKFERLLRRTIREDIAIHMHLADDLPMINGDIGQLEQVVMNLAVNAQDAMPGGGALTLETAVADLDESYAAEHDGVVPGPHVVLAVSDTGGGMDAETREHLFEPFFTTKEKEKGTGLGLATVYGIVKQHDGHVRVYTEPGMGSTLKVYLPVADGTARGDAGNEKPAQRAGGTETILLVEDNPQVRNLALAILKRQGYRIIAASGGPEALSILDRQEGPVDLLLTDVVMPEMNGRQLYERVSAVLPHIRVLYMSGYTDNVIAHHGVVDTGIDYIQKPFSNQALTAKVREILDR